MKLNLFISTIVLLTGCKASLEAQVNLSDLLSSKTKDITGDLYLEVTTCSSYKDSRQESSSLIKAKNTVPHVFLGAKYIECFRKEFESFAHFQLPIKLDKDHDGKLASDSQLNIISNSKELLTVGIPRLINKKIENVKNESYTTKDLELVFQIKVVNDTGRDHPFVVFSSYLNGSPYTYGNSNSKAGSSFVVKLSDVSVDQAISFTTSHVLFHDEQDKK